MKNKQVATPLIINEDIVKKVKFIFGETTKIVPVSGDANNTASVIMITNIGKQRVNLLLNPSLKKPMRKEYTDTIKSIDLEIEQLQFKKKFFEEILSFYEH